MSLLETVRSVLSTVGFGPRRRHAEGDREQLEALRRDKEAMQHRLWLIQQRQDIKRRAYDA